MYKCANCNHTFDIPVKYCSNCGAAMAETVEQPVIEQPIIEQPAPIYQQPVVTYNTQSQQVQYAPAPSMGKAIVGMVFGIEAVFTVTFGSLHSFIFMAVEPMVGLIISIFFSIFSLPISIIGLALSSSSINQGNTSAICKVGKILGLIALIVSCSLIALGFLLTIGETSYWY